ncbi:hypothetical protein ACFVUS_21215 [Nocardia sp. NPDC058058]|uniref:hypothetical protein n=1 Tax=Nocardia sp. NPDC058058 TaxID=3346317 RepID=UPI0036DA9F10
MIASSTSAPKKSRRRMALRVAAAGVLAAVPLALVALPATASAATPDNTVAVAQQVDQPGWNGGDNDRDHHHRGNRGDHPGDHDWNQGGQPGDNTPPPAPWQPPATGSAG